MATVVEQRSHSHLGGMGGYSHYPQFTNPWATNNLPSPHAQMYHGHMSPAHEYPQDQRTVTTSMGYAPSAPTSMASDMQARGYNTTYAQQPATPQGVYPPTSAPRYSPEQQYPYAFDRRQQPYPTKPQLSARDSFNDALDASQGMVAMSQDMTPRNIYQGRNGSQDSYGFPAHSHTSSISSSSGYGTYYQSSYSGSYSGSVDGNSSVTDYSSTSEDALNSRTLPAPGSQMVGSFPPEPTTMMSQFNSKLAPSAQKKHKCKICDKRFTRPSSLQTHMYSHTGEKPFVCDHEGCGRHFSVVSNLRRHKKVHKNSNEHPSPDEE